MLSVLYLILFLCTSPKLIGLNTLETNFNSLAETNVVRRFVILINNSKNDCNSSFAKAVVLTQFKQQI
jgi:hypothetical protein